MVFRMHFSREMLASCAWDLGEDELAERALTLSDDKHAAIQRLAARYHDPSYPLPIVGQQVSTRHVIVLAGLTLVEGRLRAPARVRARPQRDRPERFTPTGPDLDVT